jgi:uncharacterized membrane protein
MKDLDLSNAEGLDESITEDYSNSVAGLIRNAKLKKTIKGLTGCKKPLFNVGKKKKEYEKCLSDYKAAQANQQQELENTKKQLESNQSSSSKSAESSKRELEAVKAQLAELSASKSNNSSRESDNSESDDKFLGMPKAVGITVTVVGALALIVGGIFLVKKLRK